MKTCVLILLFGGLAVAGVSQRDIDRAAGNYQEATKNVSTLALQSSPLEAPEVSGFHTEVVETATSSRNVGTAAAGCQGSIGPSASGCSGYAQAACHGFSRRNAGCYGRRGFLGIRNRIERRQARRAMRS